MMPAMTERINYEDLISATRGQIRYCGGNPQLADSFAIESAMGEVRPRAARNMTNYQFNEFMRRFRKWQRSEYATNTNRAQAA